MMRILAVLLLTMALPKAAVAERPNILWISCEDIGPHLGCYGYAHAKTPTLDALAARGVRYSHAFATCPVCATNRSSIITGMYPTTLGTHGMRSQVALPDDVKCFSEVLRGAGYYCANNAKTDYNFTVPKGAWDASSEQAHWRNRRPGQPFFFVRNFTNTHESRIWPRGERHLRQTPDLKPADRQDPAALKLPLYYPDAPEVRRDWANYLENITQLDYHMARLLKELKDDGLADDTIIFFWSDHGAGMPRAKRWLYDSGTHVPLLVVIPEKLRVAEQGKPGTVDDQLVSAIDLAPTVLTLCGVELPKQFQGRAFMGANLSPPRQHVVGTRDRMDERTDMIRSVRDKRYHYIRNYMPWRPYSQWIGYAARNATMQELRRQLAAGEIVPRSTLVTGDTPEATARRFHVEANALWHFMGDHKPAEELYDTQSDPDEIDNLTLFPRTPEDEARLRKFRDLLDAWQLETRNLGLLPESIVAEEEEKFGNRRAILDSAEGRQRIAALQKLLRQTQVDGHEVPLALDPPDAALRWWSVRTQATPLLPQRLMKQPVDNETRKQRQAMAARLRPALQDDSKSVRVAAAEVIGKLDAPAPVLPVLIAACENENPWTRLAAVTALDELGTVAAAARPVLERRLKDPEPYVVRVAERALKK